MQENSNILEYSWEDFNKDLKYITDRSSALNSDVVVGIANGGLSLMIALSEKLGLPSNIVRCHSYVDKVGKDLVIEALPDRIHIYKKKILLVDDICDRGNTLVRIKEELLDLEAESVVTVTLCYKEHASVIPDIYSRTIPNDQWVIFPWEESL